MSDAQSAQQPKRAGKRRRDSANAKPRRRPKKPTAPVDQKAPAVRPAPFQKVRPPPKKSGKKAPRAPRSRTREARSGTPKPKWAPSAPPAEARTPAVVPEPRPVDEKQEQKRDTRPSIRIRANPRQKLSGGQTLGEHVRENFAHLNVELTGVGSYDHPMARVGRDIAHYDTLSRALGATKEGYAVIDVGANNYRSARLFPNRATPWGLNPRLSARDEIRKEHPRSCNCTFRQHVDGLCSHARDAEGVEIDDGFAVYVFVNSLYYITKEALEQAGSQFVPDSGQKRIFAYAAVHRFHGVVGSHDEHVWYREGKRVTMMTDQGVYEHSTLDWLEEGGFHHGGNTVFALPLRTTGSFTIFSLAWQPGRRELTPVIQTTRPFFDSVVIIPQVEGGHPPTCELKAWYHKTYQWNEEHPPGLAVPISSEVLDAVRQQTKTVSGETNRMRAALYVIKTMTGHRLKVNELGRLSEVIACGRGSTMVERTWDMHALLGLQPLDWDPDVAAASAVRLSWSLRVLILAFMLQLHHQKAVFAIIQRGWFMAARRIFGDAVEEYDGLEVLFKILLALVVILISTSRTLGNSTIRFALLPFRIWGYGPNDNRNRGYDRLGQQLWATSGATVSVPPALVPYLMLSHEGAVKLHVAIWSVAVCFAIPWYDAEAFLITVVVCIALMWGTTAAIVRWRRSSNMAVDLPSRFFGGHIHDEVVARGSSVPPANFGPNVSEIYQYATLQPRARIPPGPDKGSSVYVYGPFTNRVVPRSPAWSRENEGASLRGRVLHAGNLDACDRAYGYKYSRGKRPEVTERQNTLVTRILRSHAFYEEFLALGKIQPMDFEAYVRGSNMPASKKKRYRRIRAQFEQLGGDKRALLFMLKKARKEARMLKSETTVRKDGSHLSPEQAPDGVVAKDSRLIQAWATIAQVIVGPEMAALELMMKARGAREAKPGTIPPVTIASGMNAEQLGKAVDAMSAHVVSGASGEVKVRGHVEAKRMSDIGAAAEEQEYDDGKGDNVRDTKAYIDSVDSLFESGLEEHIGAGFGDMCRFDRSIHLALKEARLELYRRAGFSELAMVVFEFYLHAEGVTKYWEFRILHGVMSGARDTSAGNSIIMAGVHCLAMILLKNGESWIYDKHSDDDLEAAIRAVVAAHENRELGVAVALLSDDNSWVARTPQLARTYAAILRMACMAFGMRIEGAAGHFGQFQLLAVRPWPAYKGDSPKPLTVMLPLYHRLIPKLGYSINADHANPHVRDKIAFEVYSGAAHTHAAHPILRQFFAKMKKLHKQEVVATMAPTYKVLPEGKYHPGSDASSHTYRWLERLFGLGHTDEFTFGTWLAAELDNRQYAQNKNPFHLAHPLLNEGSPLLRDPMFPDDIAFETSHEEVTDFLDDWRHRGGDINCSAAASDVVSER